MNRFFALAVSCLALCGCVSEQGANLSASVDNPGDYVARTDSDTRRAPATEGEPIAHVVGSFQPPKRAPLPPKRPDLGDAQVATASVATQQQPVVASKPEPIARVETAAAAPSPEPAEQAAEETVIAPTTRSYAPTREPITTNDRPPLVRAAFTPANPTRFEPSRGGYGYSIPEPRMSDDGLQMTPRNDGGIEKTTPRSSLPGQRYYAAYSNTEISCFPQLLREALNTIAQHYGKEVEVTSGLRHNGRRGSYHRKCMAADIRVEGVGPGALAAFAKTIDGVNGVGTYRHNNVTHVDIRDYQMSWRY